MSSIPWLDEMGGEEDDTEDNAQAGDDDVGDAQEVVATAHNGTGGDDDGLGAPVFGSGENCHIIVSIVALCADI